MNRTPPADPTLESFRAIEEVLAEQERAYRALRELVARRREAVRIADLEALKTTLDEERELVVRITSLDKQRVERATALAKRLGFVIGPQKPLPAVSELVAKAPSNLRERLTAIAGRLRDEINAVRRESGVVRHAAEALAQHVAGVLQTVSSAFASSKTYGRAGRVATASPIRSIDLRS